MTRKRCRNHQYGNQLTHCELGMEDNWDWWMFDIEQCWRDLLDLWTEWELRNMLMHRSWTRDRTTQEDGETCPKLVHG